MRDREAADLRRRVARLHRGEAGDRFPTMLRDRITAWVRARRAGGAWWCELAGEVGLPAATLKRWATPRRSGPITLRPVEVVGVPPLGTVTLVTPSGLRLEGVTVTAAIAILRGVA